LPGSMDPMHSSRMPNPAKVASTSQHIARLGAFRPIERRTALADGITEGRIRAAMAAGTIVALQPGTLLPAAVWQGADDDERHLLALQSALLRHSNAVGSHRSAALVLDLPIDAGAPSTDPDLALGPVPVAEITQPGVGRRQPRLRIHPGPIPESQRAHSPGLPVTSVGRTALDLALQLPPPQALAALDVGMRRLVADSSRGSDVRQACISPEQRATASAHLAQILGQMHERRGVLGLTRLLPLAEPASESHLESLSRWQMHRHRVTPPQCGVPVIGDDGRAYWADFVWQHAKVIGEADGEGKYLRREDLVAEKRRQECLERAGWLVIRWNWFEAVVQPAIMIGRINKALAYDAPRSRRR